MSQPIPQTNSNHDFKRSLSQEIIIDAKNQKNDAKKTNNLSTSQDNHDKYKYSDHFIDEYNKMLDDSIAERESQNIENYPDSQDFWDGSVDYLGFLFEQGFGYPPDFSDYQ